MEDLHQTMRPWLPANTTLGHLPAILLLQQHITAYCFGTCQPHHSPVSLSLQLHNIACISYYEFFTTISSHIAIVIYIFMDHSKKTNRYQE
jgi:hypothetical protein